MKEIIEFTIAAMVVAILFAAAFQINRVQAGSTVPLVYDVDSRRG